MIRVSLRNSTGEVLDFFATDDQAEATDSSWSQAGRVPMRGEWTITE